MKDGAYAGGAGEMGYYEVTVSQEKESILEEGGAHKRQHSPELDRRQRKRVRVETP